MVFGNAMPGTRESERRGSQDEGRLRENGRSAGIAEPHTMHSLPGRASRAESDDRILRGKRIERRDGSGDRQRCRPPFCVGRKPLLPTAPPPPRERFDDGTAFGATAAYPMLCFNALARSWPARTDWNARSTTPRDVGSRSVSSKAAVNLALI